MRELRRQYDPGNEPSHPLAKGAAKVKAWARQNKLGIDIRLRRKINAEHDEITDIRLVAEQNQEQGSNLPLVAELPGAPNEISELPDSSLPQELSNEDDRERTQSAMDAPPVYEPPNGDDVTHLGNTMFNAGSPRHDRRQALHRSSSSDSSIITTPKRGLSLDRSGVESEARQNEADEIIVRYSDPPAQSASPKSPEVETLHASLERANQELDRERQTRRRFEDLLQDVKDELGHQRARTHDTDRNPGDKSIFDGLKVAAVSRYETETDVEPPSPSERRSKTAVRGKKAPIYPKRKKIGTKTSASNGAVGDLPAGTEPVLQTHHEGLLERQPTLPKRTPASAGPEEVWSALLQSQAQLIGPEHPLTYQARSDLARSRVNRHSDNRMASLSALRRSQTLAVQLLGEGHPLVAAFSADLVTLELLLGALSPTSATLSDDATETIISGLPFACTSPATPLVLVEPDHAHKGNGANRKEGLPSITTTFHPADKEPSPITHKAQMTSSVDPWNVWRPPHTPRNSAAVLASLVFGSLTKLALDGILWLQQTYGPELPVEPGKVRVRWTCACGGQMHDDFVEKRPGTARELEAYLNRPRTHTGGTPTSPSSSQGSRSFNNSSFGGPPSSQTSWSSYGCIPGPTGNGKNSKTPVSLTGLPFHMPLSALPEPPWLLTCANEDRYTPKLAHLDMAPHNIRSDKDLAMSLRNHYFNVNKKWWRVLKLRSLATIEFVQFEVHQNRFADIRKSPDVPPNATSGYNFEPGDLLPPVGSHYLLHLFKHPEDYDGELITYLRAPKKNGRLQLGRGWGISLVEGFEATKVWLMVSSFFALGSLVFGIAWAWNRHDVQGAFGVAAWICTLAVLAVGWLQATLG